MRTIVLQQPGRFEQIRTDAPGDPSAGEALLKVHRIGICGTDLHAYKGDQPFLCYPRILGHELGVEVVAVGEGVTHVAPGDRCAVEPYRHRADDHAARRGKTNCAEHLSVLGVHEDGGMREYVTFPARYLHRSETLSYEQLALVEPLGIGCHAVNRARVTADDTVLVIGAGPIGLGAMQFAQAAGAPVIAMDINPDRLAFCREALPIAGTVDAREDVEGPLRRHFDGDLPTIVFDATGNPASMMKAFDYVAHGGTLVYLGLFQGDVQFHDPLFHRKELTLMASRNALGSEFRHIIHAIETGRIETDSWITHQVAFDAMIDHFDAWLRPETRVIKAMVSVT